MKKQLNNKNNQKNNSTLYLMWSCILGIFCFIGNIISAIGSFLIGFIAPLLGGLLIFLMGLFWKGAKKGINNFFKPDANTVMQTVMIQDESKQKQEQEARELQYSKQLAILKEKETHKKLQLQMIEKEKELKLQLQMIEKEKELKKLKLQLQMIEKEKELKLQLQMIQKQKEYKKAIQEKEHLQLLMIQKQKETKPAVQETNKEQETSWINSNTMKKIANGVETGLKTMADIAEGAATGLAMGVVGALGGAPMLI